MTIETRHRSDADPGGRYARTELATRPVPPVRPPTQGGRRDGRTTSPLRNPTGNRRSTIALLVVVAVASAVLFGVLAVGAYANATVPGILNLVGGTLLGGATIATAAAVRAATAAPLSAGPTDQLLGADEDTLPTGRGATPAADADLLLLAEVGRTLPAAQDVDELLEPVRALLVERFGVERVAVFAVEDDRWYPQLVAGFGPDPDPDREPDPNRDLDSEPDGVLGELPPPFDRAVLDPSVLRLDDLVPVAGRTGSGLYARLIVDGMDVGLLGVEHADAAHFDQRDVELFDAVAELVGLGLANARAFTRLRSLAAAEERARIARDLHDRLGQWLTYISLELERLSTARPQPDPEMERLQRDVRSAIDELRNALVDLRTTIRAGRPLAAALPEVVERFAHRTGLQVSLNVGDPAGERLSGVVENELLRIVQESLTNIEKHADATEVHISYSVSGGRGVLTIEDNGRGFDPTRGIRSTAYGLVGMRERAAAVGAIVEIASQRGTGTVVTVLAGTEECRP